MEHVANALVTITSFVIPSGLNPATISAVGVAAGGAGYGAASGSGQAGGGGGGGALAYKNSISVTASQTWTIVVGAQGTSTGQNASRGGHTQLKNPSSSIVLEA